MSTGIEWTDETWNPVTGCTKVSQGCKHCYAERVAERLWKGRSFGDVQLHHDRLERPLHWKKPRRVFVNSMSDLFHEDVDLGFVLSVWQVMANDRCRDHTFQILTKRPARMLEMLRDIERGSGCSVSLPNVWLGVSVEDQATADERVPLLLRTPAAKRFVSYEPALGPVDFTRVRWARLNLPKPFTEGWSLDNVLTKRPADDLGNIEKTGLDWIIAGGESGSAARPAHPDWFRSARDQCVAAGVPFFFKQWGEFVPLAPLYGDDEDLDKIANADERRTVLIAPAGSDWTHERAQPPPNTWAMQRVGRGRAGRELDGRTWDQFPEAR